MAIARALFFNVLIAVVSHFIVLRWLRRAHRFVLTPFAYSTGVLVRAAQPAVD